MSRLSKQQLAGKLAKKALTLDEKIKFFDFAKKTPMLGCRKLIRKTAAGNVLKYEKKKKKKS